MAPSADIFFEHEEWRKPVVWSALLHLAVAGLVSVYSALVHTRPAAIWGTGGGGEAMGVTLVSTVPLPATQTQTQNVLANESKGLTQSLPKTEEEDRTAIPIADKVSIKKLKKTPSENKAKREPMEAATNVVPFGQGGPVSGPYGSFSAGGAKGGFGFSSGGGDFGDRFGWYVQVIQRKISENWLKYEVDPRISEARRVYLTFDIDRSGRPGKVELEQSSGVPSLDISAMRALQRIDTFGPLPADYSGSHLSVEWWFDYGKK